jgi:hypothetical protein
MRPTTSSLGAQTRRSRTGGTSRIRQIISSNSGRARLANNNRIRRTIRDREGPIIPSLIGALSRTSSLHPDRTGRLSRRHQSRTGKILHLFNRTGVEMQRRLFPRKGGLRRLSSRRGRSRLRRSGRIRSSKSALRLRRIDRSISRGRIMSHLRQGRSRMIDRTTRTRRRIRRTTKNTINEIEIEKAAAHEVRRPFRLGGCLRTRQISAVPSCGSAALHSAM